MWCSVLPIVLSFFLQLYQVNALKGDSQCGYLVCVNATVHHDTVTYQMTARKEKMGWLALGFGRRMAGSDMVVMWRNEDDSLTISHRHGYDHTEPVVVEEPLRIAFLPMLQPTVWDSNLNPANTLSFSIPLDKSQWVFKPEKNASFEQLIWAYGMTRPASPDPHTTIYGHYAAGMLLLNLEKDISVTSPEGSLDDTTSSPVISQDPLFYSTHELVVLAHGFLIAIGMLWFKIHKTLNYVIALPIILVGWTLGPFAVFNARATHFSDAHQICGVLILVLYLLQLSLGRYIHARRGLPNRAVHAPSNILHVFWGLVVICAVLKLVQVWSGMNKWAEHTGRPVSQWCHTLWKVWIYTLPVLYLLGLSLLKRQLYQESHGLNPSFTPKHYVALSPDEGHRSMLFDADTDLSTLPDGYPNYSPNGITKEAETAVPLLRRN
ncbi:uncharacterized protein C8R40DRAFT_1226448 [Lentinula edodes]|uniref:uncharacterized protein n=1 Tax=Lentinula edodes TaxID=5353 RepID=UPI001E8D1EAD|nr:uncharacterized protein C8R40DRAFT_1226448 [Lentinula edodes]KAH7877682.1 hypothetical protein C8R40DRAFT_1226448 [Lentinula edodes]KAJ3921095.1 hypothetical protein F5877DRAFT_36729 [Lentinula edodes]